MPSVTLHIGLSKTGTTACQTTFDSRREDLRRAGLLYPRAGIEASHHFLLAEALLSGRKRSDDQRAAVRAAYRAEVELAGLPVLLSSEHFSDATDEDIADILSFLGPDTTVIVGIRNQVDWISSHYAEAIQWGYRLTFADYLERSRGMLDIEPLLWRWEAAVGRKRLHVVPYEAHRRDIVREVLRLAGLPPDAVDATASGERVHPSLAPPFVQLQYELSAEAQVAHHLKAGLEQVEAEFRRAGVSLPRAWRIPEASLAPLLELEAANQRIAQRYGLPSPLFGRSLHDLCEENRREGYAAPTFAHWLLGARARLG